MRRRSPAAARDWRATRRAFMGRAADVVPIPADALDGLAAFERDGRHDPPQPARARRGPLGGRLRARRASRRASVLEAASAQAQSAPGRDDPGLALPRRAATTASTRSSRWPTRSYRALRPRLGDRARDHPAGRRATPSSAGTRPLAGLKGAVRRRARWRCCRRWTSPTPTSRTSTRPPTGAAASWGQSFEPTGLARADARRRRHARQPAAGDQRRRGRPTRCSRSRPRRHGHGLRPERLRLLHRGRLGQRGLQRAPTATPRAAARRRRRWPPPAAPTRTPSRCATSSRRCGWTTTTRSRRSPVAYPDTDLGTGLRNLARMLGAGFGTRVAALSYRRASTPTTTSRPSTPSCSPTSRDSLGAWQADLTAARARRPRPDPHLERVRPPPGGQRVERHRPRRRRPGDGGRRPRQRRHPSEFPGLSPPRRGRQPPGHHGVPHGLRDAARVVARRRGGPGAARASTPPACRSSPRAAGAAPGGCYPARPRGRLAQLGEHQLDKLGVTGSSPVTPTSESPASRGFSALWSRLAPGRRGGRAVWRRPSPVSRATRGPGRPFRCAASRPWPCRSHRPRR